MVTILVGRTGLQFIKDTKRAVRIGFFEIGFLEVIATSRRVKDVQPREGKARKVVGQKKVDGKPCDVVRVTPRPPSKANPRAPVVRPFKEWVWKGKDLVLKRVVERTRKGTVTRLTTTLSNVSEDPLDDALFELSGFEIVKHRRALFSSPQP